ncbi:DUF488 family protein [Methylococcus geothermalis]|uniref:DUF488 family protein n=1 Tax=Methylococcus geothermalis TaxID=2681310 RepID=A0A858QBW8_9GAMM|nr:DUF488 family protein [Methylococcus geothermalis]
MAIRLKRVYEERSPEDGERFLVERLWPRGMSRQSLALSAWLKDLAPTTELRRWYGHDPGKWEEFRHRYCLQLDRSPEALQSLLQACAHGTVTLLYSARDTERNSAVVLRDFLERQLGSDHT